MIDDKTYKLPNTNYNLNITDKKRIVMCNSFSVNMNHYVGWLTRNNGRYKKTAHYTISLDGLIYEHINFKFTTELLGETLFDNDTIYVVLENEGWLIKDLNIENSYINYVGNIYNRIDTVCQKKWRNKLFWAPYSEQQFNSSVHLIKHLMLVNNISGDVPITNIKINGEVDQYGVLYRSNIDGKYTDLNPCWDFINFKDKLIDYDK